MEKEELWENVVNIDVAMMGLLEETETEKMVEEVTEFHRLDGMEIMGDLKDEEEKHVVKVHKTRIDEVEKEELWGNVVNFDEAMMGLAEEAETERR